MPVPPGQTGGSVELVCHHFCQRSLGSLSRRAHLARLQQAHRDASAYIAPCSYAGRQAHVLGHAHDWSASYLH